MIKDHISNITNDGFTVIKNGVNVNDKNILLNIIKDLELNSSIYTMDEENIPYLNRGHKVIYNLQNKNIDCIKIVF